ncbi:ISC system 2Fe-2S type ferredoxin [Ralstonia pseudosolanacearum]
MPSTRCRTARTSSPPAAWTAASARRWPANASRSSADRRPSVLTHLSNGFFMPQIVVLPHVEYCPEGAVIEAKPGTSICDALLGAHIEIEHACEKSCACTTCHVIVREGFDSLGEATEKEEDLLDKAWGLEPNSRLSCQAKVADEDLTVEIPKYSINHAKETH